MAEISSEQKPNSPRGSVGVTSQSTRRLEELQRRVPVVGDKALINLVNGIQVSKDLLHYIAPPVSGPLV